MSQNTLACEKDLFKCVLDLAQFNTIFESGCGIPKPSSDGGGNLYKNKERLLEESYCDLSQVASIVNVIP